VCVRACCGQVDVYPTVAALAGLPPPPDIVGRPLNQVGTSLEPVFLDPAVKPGTVKDYAFSEFPQCPGIHPVPGRSAAVPPLLSSPHLTCRRISDSAVSACHAHVCLCSPLCEDKSGHVQYSRVSLTLTSNLSVRVCDRVAAVVCVLLIHVGGADVGGVGNGWHTDRGCQSIFRENIGFFGFSVRSLQWRYTGKLSSSTDRQRTAYCVLHLCHC